MSSSSRRTDQYRNDTTTPRERPATAADPTDQPTTIKPRPRQSENSPELNFRHPQAHLPADDPPADLDDLVRRVLEGGLEFADELPDGFGERHLPHAESISQLINGDELDTDEQTALEAVVDLGIDQIRAELALDHDVAADEQEWAGELSEDDETPTIVCSAMVSAKGLSAEHVFIVGFNNDHFPRHAEAITDYEICCLLVALSRTRKQCHLVSCGRWKGEPVEVSSFSDWLGVPLEETTRNAAYWAANPPL